MQLAVAGAVNTSLTPYVLYSYKTSGNSSRPTSITYPHGEVVSLTYDTGLDDTISRLSALGYESDKIEDYLYLGLSSVVVRGYADIDVQQTYYQSGKTGDAGDQYVGLDRFGRVVELQWLNGKKEDMVHFKYGYDRDSNRLYRTNEMNHDFDELYHANGSSNGYDTLNQLKAFGRGQLNGGNDSITTTSRSQTWTVDGLGNFSKVVTTAGSTTTENRDHDLQNRLIGIGSDSLTYDEAGNLTEDDQDLNYTFDAWNRMMKVEGTTRYGYDAMGRRIKEGDRALYYSKTWQVLEQHEAGNVVFQYIWSPVYVDAMIVRIGFDIYEEPDKFVYALADANWNVVALADNGDEVFERFIYDPYGRFEILDEDWGARSKSDADWVYLHQGGRWEDAAELYSFRHRDYSARLMRWVEMDPVFSSNLYRGYNNNPNVMVDPAGADARVIDTGVHAIFNFDVYVPVNCDGLEHFLKVGTMSVDLAPTPGAQGSLGRNLTADTSDVKMKFANSTPRSDVSIPGVPLEDHTMLLYILNNYWGMTLPEFKKAIGIDDSDPNKSCDEVLKGVKSLDKTVTVKRPYNALTNNSNHFVAGLLSRYLNYEWQNMDWSSVGLVSGNNLKGGGVESHAPSLIDQIRRSIKANDAGNGRPKNFTPSNHDKRCARMIQGRYAPR